MNAGATAKALVGRGRLVAAALAGAWRRSPPPLTLSVGDLATLAPLLLGTGGAGLLWWRFRSTELAACPFALELKQAYRFQTLQALLHENQIARAVTLLRSAGIEPLLAKGWVLARLYPEAGLRPSGDIDLWVLPEQHAAAEGVLRSPAAQGCPVDLHQRCVELRDRSLADLFQRSRLVRLGKVEVRILGPEDHLRLLCVHMLAHGAWRPLWLCDIAVAVEARPEDFDWDCCLAGSRQRAEYVLCAMGLAHRLLGARLDGTAGASGAARLPGWLVSTVLREWGAGYSHRRPLMTYLRHPAGLLQALRRCWPNPILATVEVGGPFNELPRLPFQFAQCLSRTAQIAAELAGSLRKRQ